MKCILSQLLMEKDDLEDVPAVRLYLTLGFYALITDTTHSARWKALDKKLDVNIRQSRPR